MDHKCWTCGADMTYHVGEWQTLTTSPGMEYGVTTIRVPRRPYFECTNGHRFDAWEGMDLTLD